MAASKMDMKMVATDDIEIGESLTPPLPPLSAALSHSLFHSHCPSCFSPLPSSGTSFYCSATCAAAHTPHLHPEDSDLSVALRLRLLLPFPSSLSSDHHRILGVITNRSKLTSSSEFSHKVRRGARAIAAAVGVFAGDLSYEEALLSLVITNSVEVIDETGRSLGIAVYGPMFSWINHSCSPNACYSFAISSPNTAQSSAVYKCRLAPSTLGDVCSQECSDVLANNLYSHHGSGTAELGPKVIVRSIKRIRKGEEVTVSYIDLLQPKAMRQSELCSKYQFICSCSRCNVSTPGYVDRALQELSPYGPDVSRTNDDFSSLCNLKFADYIDETISEYLSVGDPQLCCKKLENVLRLGLVQLLETNGGNCSVRCRLNPLHYLALSAYTTLASAYKMRSVDHLSLGSNTKSKEHLLNAFDMSRISAGYYLLLAGATSQLFNSEASLIAYAANFWIGAGESILTLSSKFGGVMLADQGCSSGDSLNPSQYKCPNCSLMDMFDENLALREAQYTWLGYISTRFMDCLSSMITEIWGVLVYGCCYLEAVEDPVDFSLQGKARIIKSLASNPKEVSKFTAEGGEQEPEIRGYTNETRVKIHELGVHCLLYGEYLANACYGHSKSSHVINRIKDNAHNDR